MLYMILPRPFCSFTIMSTSRHFSLLGGLLGAIFLTTSIAMAETPVVPSGLKLLAPNARDQDDMCFWIHPTRPEMSTIITSDKAAGCLHVYDLSGQVLQQVDVPKPGNIDLRNDFPFRNEKITIVALNQRSGTSQIRIWKVDSQSRRLEAIATNIPTGQNYGGCLYRSLKTGRFYFLVTSKSEGAKLFEIFDNQNGGIDGRLIRSWDLGFSEGAVADDENAMLYVSEERKGIWKLSAESDQDAPPKLIAPVGKNGTRGDLEGLAIYKTSPRQGYLLVSDQGRNRFQAFQRDGDNAYLGEFEVKGVRVTDGIETVNAIGLPGFEEGLFACHTDPLPCAVILVPWKGIREALKLPQ
ncbi:MAG TPA: phytase [Planctomicrobium sp.]|nr:phytase [Planctomicrobium sp.]